jgi:hypothetical protein
VWTDTGLSACLDLALALVTVDHGQDVARSRSEAPVSRRPVIVTYAVLPTATFIYRGSVLGIASET